MSASGFQQPVAAGRVMARMQLFEKSAMCAVMGVVAVLFFHWGCVPRPQV